jgi:ATP-dependent helicase/DNAse subunit B
MGLALVVGPANAGKVASLLDRYVEALDRDPVLIVPNRSDVDRVEPDLLRRRPALLSGSIGTFDDLFDRLGQGCDDVRPVVGAAQRALLVRRAVAGASLNGLGRSARFAGFAEALAGTLAELDSGLLDPAELDGDVAALYAAYRHELERLGRWDRGLLRRRAVERLASDLAAWDGQPVFAYGFEDLTGAEWGLLETLAGRAEVHVSLPYEPGRAAFASLEHTATDLAGLALGSVEELSSNATAYPHPALAHLERTLYDDRRPAQAPPLDGAVRFLEGAGTRATLELVAEEILRLIEDGTPPEQIAVVCPSVERVRGTLDTAFAALGVPCAVESRIRLGAAPFGQALLSLLRFAWLGGGRRDLYGFLRSPYSGLPRAGADFLEGRLRGRAVDDGERAEAETVRLRDGAPLPPLETLRGAPTAVAAVRTLAAQMLRNAHGVEAPPVGEAALSDLRAHDAVRRVLDELDDWLDLGESLSAEDVLAALERTELRAPATGEPGRVAVLDLMRARTRRFEVVIVLGLEEGSLPRRAQPSPFLDDDARRELDRRSRARLVRPDAVSRDRYLFYTACTRATRRVVLVREASTDEGSPREASPFWEDVRAAFDAEDVAHATVRRPLSRLTWPIERAPTDRERLRALAALHASDPAAAEALALANGWERRLARARSAFTRRTELRNPLVLEELAGRETFGVTDLERIGDCSSAWFVERYLDPRTIDGRADAKLRGSVAHTTLYRFYGGLQKQLAGAERVTEENVESAVAYLHECLAGALEGVRLELTELQRQELAESLRRDLEAFVRDEARSPSPFVPRHLETKFALDLGEGLTLTGKIDRIDVDPFGARGVVVDYKSGKGAPSARQIADDERLQIPLYMLVARDVVGIEPLGGVYRPLAGDRRARGMVRAGEGLEGFSRRDELDEDAFWEQVETSRATAQRLAGRVRAGEIRHDPRGGECPSWCDLWTICRVRRP